MVRGRWDFDSYGKRSTNLITTSALESDFAYTGHYFHERSNLTVAPYRFYDADLGKWLSRDPIGEKGGVNLYGYVHNNSIERNDPLGLAERIIGGAAVNTMNVPIKIYAGEYGVKTLQPGESSPGLFADWDSVEAPSGSKNWQKLGPGIQRFNPDGTIRFNPFRELDKIRNPDGYKPENIPKPPWPDGPDLPPWIPIYPFPPAPLPEDPLDPGYLDPSVCYV